MRTWRPRLGIDPIALAEEVIAQPTASTALPNSITISRRIGDPTPMVSDLALGGLSDGSEGSKSPRLVRLHEL